MFYIFTLYFVDRKTIIYVLYIIFLHTCVSIYLSSNKWFYFKIEAGDDTQEEYGWKLVHGDVFRPPQYGMLLAVIIGSGIQVFLMTLVTLGKFPTIC